MTDGSDPESVPLTVTTDLTLTVDGTDAALRSTGERLFIEFPSVVSAVQALRSLPPTEHRRLHSMLTTADLTLEIRARNRTLVALGAGTRSGPLARQLGIDPVELRPTGVLSALWAGAVATVDRLR
ncbi:hypothetical protein [Halobellus rufus]|uniref:hypothetical protein n=1 Tax=Halobellus rufus TaxID=1448860 RepID=UPI00067843CC|nr:hypothetical protein [Halobellus rufus]